VGSRLSPRPAGQSRRRVGLAAEFCAATADDELCVIEIMPHDRRRMAELLTPYSSLRHQLARAQWTTRVVIA
jgi:hypothetical protein